MYCEHQCRIYRHTQKQKLSAHTNMALNRNLKWTKKIRGMHQPHKLTKIFMPTCWWQWTVKASCFRAARCPCENYIWLKKNKRTKNCLLELKDELSQRSTSFKFSHKYILWVWTDMDLTATCLGGRDIQPQEGNSNFFLSTTPGAPLPAEQDEGTWG